MRRFTLLVFVALVVLSPLQSYAFSSYPRKIHGHDLATRNAAAAVGFTPKQNQKLQDMVYEVDNSETKITRYFKGGNGWLMNDRVIMGESVAPKKNKYTPEHHFDRPGKNSTFTLGVDHIAVKRELVMIAVDLNDVTWALTSLGYALHALQDFYSHTNYVDLNSTSRAELDSILVKVPATYTFTSSLMQTAYHADAHEPGRPAGDSFGHDDFCKDEPTMNAEAKKLVPAQNATKYTLALSAAIRASQRFLEYLRRDIIAQSGQAAWDRLRGTLPSPNTELGVSSHQNEEGYLWSCEQTCPTCGSLACNGTSVTFSGGVLPSGTIVSLRGVPVSMLSKVGDLRTPDGRVVLTIRELQTDACADTVFCMLSGSMTVAYTDSIFVGIERDSLSVFRLDPTVQSWTLIPQADFNLANKVVTFPFSVTGIFAIVGRPKEHGQMRVHSFDWFQDTFPANESMPPELASAFDTTAALIKTGLNTAPPAYSNRPDIPGDTVVVRARGDNVRVDLIFRILPGPGNYVTIGNRFSSLRRVPTSATSAEPNPYSSNFWESYLGDNGVFGTGGNGTSGPGHPNGVWDPNVWNSARCDTAEYNGFPVSGLGIDTPPDLGAWMTTYHEIDPKYTTLGIAKNRCFLRDTADVYQGWMCGTGPSDPVYPPTWTNDPLTGVSPSEDGLPPGQTKEMTKILPDGQFTPGTHIEYFFRKSTIGAPISNFFMLPDTNRVYPQYDEGSLDAHRWQEFSVLPDRWKEPAYEGQGKACMLVIDYADGSGDELAWVSIADSIGATAPNKRGAHNGWSARSDQDVNDPITFVSAHLGQPGLTWDFYQVRGGYVPTGYPTIGPHLNGPTSVAAGTIGSRAAYIPPGPLGEKRSRQGPTGDMLRNFYRILFLMTGEVNDGALGPYWNRSQNDVGLLQDFLAVANGSPQPRGLWVMGNGFAESNAYASTSNGTTQHPFMTDWLGVELRHRDYQSLTGNMSSCVDLIPNPIVWPSMNTIGVQSGLAGTNDVLQPVIGPLPTSFTTRYDDYGGVPSPIVAGVLKSYDPAHPWVSLVDGFDIQDIGSRYCTGTLGRRLYFDQVFMNVFGSICDVAPGIPVEVPAEPAIPLQPFLKISNTPSRTGEVGIRFGLRQGGVVKLEVYDLAGRRVATVLNGWRPAGVHTARWEGPANGAISGLYFVRYTAPDFSTVEKIVFIR